MSHKSAKETISCEDSSNVVVDIHAFDVIQQSDHGRKTFFYYFTLGEAAKDR